MLRHSLIAGLSALALSTTTLAAQERNATDCAPERGLVSIAGIVRDASGAGLPNVLVRAYGPETDSVPTGPVKLRSSSARVLRTDSAGAFCLRDLSPGRYIVNPRRMAVTRDDFNEMEIAVDVQVPDAIHRVDAVYDPRALSLAEQARRDGLREQLAEHRARWNAQRPSSYRTRIVTECACAQASVDEPTLLVAGDSVVQIVGPDSLAKGGAVRTPGSAPADSAAQPVTVALDSSTVTIDRMFDRIEQALLDPMIVVQELQFDMELGFPLLFRTDARRPLSDTGRTVRVPVFEAVQQP